MKPTTENYNAWFNILISPNYGIASSSYLFHSRNQNNIFGSLSHFTLQRSLLESKTLLYA
jgi:hypothetical protein